MPGRPGREATSGGVDAAALWADLEGIRCAAIGGASPIAATPAETRALRALLRKRAPAEVRQVWRWWWCSDHPRADYLRRKHGPSVVLKPTNFVEYLRFSQAWQPDNVLPLARGASPPPDAAEVWAMLEREAGRRGRTEPPGQAWDVHPDPDTAAAILAALRRAGGWSALCQADHPADLARMRSAFAAALGEVLGNARGAGTAPDRRSHAR